MNRLLANAMGVLNFVVGAGVLWVGVMMGATWARALFEMTGGPVFLSIAPAIGFVVGLLSAIVVCGSLALLISIYEVLKKIHTHQLQQSD